MKNILIIAPLLLIAIIIPSNSAFALGTAYTDVLGHTYFSDGSSAFTDELGHTTYTNANGSLGGTSYTDVLGHTTYSGGPTGLGTSYTDALGHTYFNFGNGVSGTAYTDALGRTYYNGGTAGNGTSYTDALGHTTYTGDIFMTHTCPANSSYNSLSNNCTCASGYKSNGTSCVYNYQPPATPTSYNGSTTTCPLNSRTSTTDSTKCQCNTGYQSNSTKDGCVVIPTKTNDQSCIDTYGVNSNWDGTRTSDGRLNCGCQSGYIWNTANTMCIQKALVPITISAGISNSSGSGLTITQIDAILSLLQSFGADAATIANVQTALGQKNN